METGLVFEQAVRIEEETGRQLELRRVELHLDEPTEDGETVIRLLTNVPEERMAGLIQSPTGEVIPPGPTAEV